MRLEAGENEAGRRLDRVLKKILKKASLSLIYRIIRKDVKVNGKRAAGETLLKQGDVIEILLPDEQLRDLTEKNPEAVPSARKQFRIVFEDENILVADKPFGLLVHGDRTEKKSTLTNQVISYLAGTGEYDHNKKGIFAPAPVNRLDRNTTGLVVFGKTLPAVRDLAAMLKGKEDGSGKVEKAYLAIVTGGIENKMILKAKMVRDAEKNVTKVLREESENGRLMVTEIVPLKAGKGYTLVEAKLYTGRTHQIRVQLADAGFPVAGDRKYGDRKQNALLYEKYSLKAQLLHAYRLRILSGIGCLEYLTGKTFQAEPPVRFAEIAEDLGCGMKTK